MRIYNRVFLVFLSLLLLSSCSTLTIVGRSTPSVNMNAQFNFGMEDLEYLGEVKGVSVQSYVLGLPIGGRRKYYGEVGIATPNSLSRKFRINNRGYDNALYDALNSKPDADFILPISTTTQVSRMFLGKKVYLTIRGKAFKLKEKKPGMDEQNSTPEKKE